MSQHPLYADLAVRLKDLRVGRSMTTAGMARALGVDRRAVYQIEDPKRGKGFRVQTLLDYAEVLDLELEIEFVEKSNGT